VFAKTKYTGPKFEFRVLHTRQKISCKIWIRILSLIYLINNLVQYTMVKILNPVYCSGRTSLESVIQSNDSSLSIKFSVISFFDSQHCFFSMKSHLKPSKTLGWFVGCKIGGPIRTLILLHKSWALQKSLPAIFSSDENIGIWSRRPSCSAIFWWYNSPSSLWQTGTLIVLWISCSISA